MSVNHIIAQMQDVFLQHTQALAVPTGFCLRRSRLDAGAWVQGLVFGWLSDPQSSVSALARSIASAGCEVSPQAVQQRFSAPGVALLRGVLEAMTAYALYEAAHKGLNRQQRNWLEQFPAIWLRDSTTIALPEALREEWPASGGVSGRSAALKVSVLWEWHRGNIAPVHITPSVRHDQKAAQEQDAQHAAQSAPVPGLAGEMHVFDLGYFKLERFEQLDAAEAYFCCRYKAATQMQRLDDPERAWADSPLEWLDALPSSVQRMQWRVLLGKKARLEVSLLALRVPAEVAQSRRHKCLEQSRSKGQKVSAQRLELCQWQLFVTNAPESLLTVEQACVLYGLRWQIERLFRLWIETLQVDLWRSQKSQRVLCEVYAKLTGALLTQKITAFCAWHEPARSLVKCAQTIAQHAMSLLTHLRFDSALRRTLRALQKACLCAAKVETRKAKPATFQRLRQLQIS